MRYLKFIIKGYRGISDLTEIDISRESLIPIIGKNESGKTTILEAIHSFYHINDNEYNSRHLSNIDNLYSTTETPLNVGALIEIPQSFNIAPAFVNILSEVREEYPDTNFRTVKLDEIHEAYRNKIMIYQFFSNGLTRGNLELVIERDLRNRKYLIPDLGHVQDEAESIDELAHNLVGKLPHILYFDDFRDRLDQKIYITSSTSHENYNRWILYINQLFKDTNENYSVFDLSTKNDSIRRSIIIEVEEHLNEVLTKEWSNYQFENNENIKIKIEYNEKDLPYITFKIIEKIKQGIKVKERVFDITDRSKGFFWYFNFMFKLYFNPNKRSLNDQDTVYLLDEPGSYLHVYAQTKLAEQLKKISKSNKVIYCTHSHNLLNPEFIPINSIRIAEKMKEGRLLLKRIDDRGLIRPTRNSAYQPILDALEVRPPIFEYEATQIILVEGIYDYYSFGMFCRKEFSFFPCVNAESLIQQIPFMIFLNKKYLAMWDCDDEGNSKLKKAEGIFGEEEAKKFILLPEVEGKNKTILEDYFDKVELKSFCENFLEKPDTTFNKAIISLFHSHERELLINKYFPNTSLAFERAFVLIKAQFDKLYTKIEIEPERLN